MMLNKLKQWLNKWKIEFTIPESEQRLNDDVGKVWWGIIFICVSLLFCFVIAGCTPDRRYDWVELEPVCSNNTVDVRNIFILQCLSNISSMKWMEKCKDMVAELYCPLKRVRVFYHNYT